MATNKGEKKEKLSKSEKDLLNKYKDRMVSAYKYGYYTAIPTTDNLTMQQIYQRVVDSNHTPRVWCGNCTINMLKGFYKYLNLGE